MQMASMEESIIEWLNLSDLSVKIDDLEELKDGVLLFELMN